MAVCKKCGKTYFTKECVQCRDNEYMYRKVNQKKENSLWIFSFFILLCISILLMVMAYFKIEELDKNNEKKLQEIERLKELNEQLQRSNNLNKRLLESLQKENRELVHKVREKSRYTQIRSHPQRIQNNNERVKDEYIVDFNRDIKSRKEKKYRKKVSKKKYPNYSGYEKLVSDSKIKRRDDNRFVSNKPIYGIYKYPLLSGITCGKSKKIYKIRNECSTYAPYSTDRLYFSKSNIRELQVFDAKTHKIECKYSQKYGIMHDCRTKIFKYK